MIARLQQSPLAALALAAALCIVAQAAVRPRAMGLRPAEADAGFDVPAIPADVTRPFSFGLRSLAADVMFIQAIQVVGSVRKVRTAAEGAADDRAVDRLLTYATDLDPRFAGAYRFAAYAMPRQTTDFKVTNVLQAEVILQKGVRERPDDWRIPFALGFIQSYYLGHFADAARNLALAGRTPGAPAYVGLLATRSAADAVDLDFAERMATVMASEASEEATRADWQRRLLDLRMERDLREIERAVAAYRARTGSPPPSLEALVKAGDLRAIPPEPHGGRYQLDKGGEPRSTGAERLRIRGRRGTTAGLEVK